MGTSIDREPDAGHAAQEDAYHVTSAFHHVSADLGMAVKSGPDAPTQASASVQPTRRFAGVQHR